MPGAAAEVEALFAAGDASELGAFLQKEPFK